MKKHLDFKDITDNIVSEHIFTAFDGRAGAIANETYVGIELPKEGDVDLDPLKQVTICVLVLANGTKVVGVNHGSIDPARHSPDQGIEDARNKAIEQVWPLMGYELRSKITTA